MAISKSGKSQSAPHETAETFETSTTDTTGNSECPLFIMKPSTSKWHRINKAGFDKWQRERKALYRATHPDRYKAELKRNRAWRKRQKHNQNVPHGKLVL
jgi:hypothetical protein